MSHPRIPYRVTDDSNVQTLIENLAEKLSKAKGGKGSGKSTGRWVTINGNRVFIGSNGVPQYGGAGNTIGKKVDRKIGKGGKERLSSKATAEDIGAIDDSYFYGMASYRGVENVGLSKAYEKQGYHQKPVVLNKKEFDEYMKESTNPEMYRGVTQKVYAEQFKRGEKHFAGTGIFTDGTYTTTDRREAEGYGKGGETMRMTLHKSAKVVTYKALTSEISATQERIGNPMEKVFGMNTRATPGSAEYNKVREAWVNAEKTSRKVYSLGGQAATYATLRGYDAIRVEHDGAKNGDFYIILNRGKVVVEG